MAAKKARRVPTELKAIQDERLTCRHIKALMQLQQTTDENEELKSKLKTLEVVELSNLDFPIGHCPELVTIVNLFF